MDQDFLKLYCAALQGMMVNWTGTPDSMASEAYRYAFAAYVKLLKSADEVPHWRQYGVKAPL